MTSTATAWIAGLPKRWGRSRLKYLTTCNNEVLSETTPVDLEIQYVDIGSVSSVGLIEKTETMLFGTAPSRARRLVRSGDVLVSTVRTYLKAIAPVKEAPDNLIASTGFAVIRCGESAYPGYMAYALRTEGFVAEVIARSVGISYPAINASDLIDLSIPAPPFEEQTQIAKFLDYETAKIDALIEKQQQLIALLKEKRQAVISHAVTKGLDPNAPMKDSGVEWLGKVPAHWKVLPLRHALKIDNGPRLPINRTERAEMSGPYPYWGPTSIVDHIDHYRYEGERAIIGEDGDHFLKFAIWPMTHWASGKFNVNNHAHVIADGPNCTARWFYYSFLHRDIGGDVIAQGVSRLKLSREGLSKLMLAVPPPEEQSLLIAHVEPVLTKVERATVAAHAQITLLQERRTALISAAVTGKIDVRGWKPPRSEEPVA